MSEQTNNSEYNTVTLSLDDGTECECAIIRIFLPVKMIILPCFR